MTIYQWLFFDREDMFFHHIESTSKDEADRMAWDYYNAYVSGKKENGDLNTVTAETFEEFVSDTYQYVDNEYTAGLEASFVVLEV